MEENRRSLRCAIYTRKSTEEGLEQQFNTLQAQREAAEAYIRSQQPSGWIALPDVFDDGGFTGANMDRPALKQLLGQCCKFRNRTRVRGEDVVPRNLRWPLRRVR